MPEKNDLLFLSWLFNEHIAILANMEKDPVYRFVAHKKAEGKHFYSYMVAGCNKFLRIYYARVKAYLNHLEQQESDSLIDGSGGSEVVLQPLDC